MAMKFRLLSLSVPSSPPPPVYFYMNPPHWNVASHFLHMLARERWQWHFKHLQKLQSQDALLCHELPPVSRGSSQRVKHENGHHTLCLALSGTVPLLPGMLGRQS